MISLFCFSNKLGSADIIR